MKDKLTEVATKERVTDYEGQTGYMKFHVVCKHSSHEEGESYKDDNIEIFVKDGEERDKKIHDPDIGDIPIFRILIAADKSYRVFIRKDHVEADDYDVSDPTYTGPTDIHHGGYYMLAEFKGFTQKSAPV